MIVEIGCTMLAIFFGLLLWLKSKLPDVDERTAQLIKHKKMYICGDADEDDAKMKSVRKENYLELTENYYNLTTDLFHIIWGPHYSMGCPFPKEFNQWQTYPESQTVYQCYLGLSLKADENCVIGDFGCGTGGPTRCIAQFTGAKIKAVNITKYHLKQAKKFTEEFGLTDQIEYIHSDYHHTPLKDESLDGVYMCESLAHSPDYKMLCREVFRVLKPGARFTGYNWELLESFDETNAEHRKIRFMLCNGLGMSQMVKMSALGEALKEAGFNVICQRDHTDFVHKLGAKNWWFLFEETNSLQALFSSLTTLVWLGVYLLELFKMVSPGTTDAYDSLMICLKDGMVEGYRQKIFSPMAYWLAEKPLK